MTLRAHRGYEMERCDKCGRNGQLPEWKGERNEVVGGLLVVRPEHLHFSCPCGWQWDVRPLDAPRPKLVQRASCI